MWALNERVWTLGSAGDTHGKYLNLTSMPYPGPISSSSPGINYSILTCRGVTPWSFSPKAMCHRSSEQRSSGFMDPEDLRRQKHSNTVHL